MILKTVFPYSHFQWLKLHSFPNRSGVHLSKRVSQVQISFLNPHLLVGQLYQVRRPFDVLCVMFRMIIQFHQYKHLYNLNMECDIQHRVDQIC